MKKDAALWLFDIDGTLVDTGGAGMRALHEASEECFGDPGPRLDLAGSTDLSIARGIFAHFGAEPVAERVECFFSAYLARLEWNLGRAPYVGRVLPGVVALLERLEGMPAVTTGLLTGNIAGGAAAKMRHFGLARHFPFGAYGCDHADRNQLGPVALRRASEHAGRKFTAVETLVIGDTPKDIACAKAIGARCLAVATGMFGTSELEASGADFTVESLEQVLTFW
jgi:phosphoglycolate phosphatase